MSRLYGELFSVFLAITTVNQSISALLEQTDRFKGLPYILWYNVVTYTTLSSKPIALPLITE
jgi:hypothetical protein